MKCFNLPQKAEILFLMRLTLLCSFIILASGCSVKNKNTEQTHDISQTIVSVAETIPDESITTKKETFLKTEQSSGTSFMTIPPGTTQQGGEIIIINLFNDDVYSLPMAAQITTPDDPRMVFVTSMSWDELSEYYDLIIDEKVLTDIVRSVSGRDIVTNSFSTCLPSTGIYQEDIKVYDANVLEFDSKWEKVTIIFSRNNNILWPGSEVLSECEPTGNGYGKSQINGIECIIGQPVNSSMTGDEHSLEIRTALQNTEITIVIGGFSKERAIILFQRISAALTAGK